MHLVFNDAKVNMPTRKKPRKQQEKETKLKSLWQQWEDGQMTIGAYVRQAGTLVGSNTALEEILKGNY